MANVYKCGDKDIRPWGTWEVLAAEKDFCVKKICVAPRGKLSLQMHRQRAEYWIILEGEALVTVNEDQFIRKAGEAVYIPLESKHRIQNDGTSEVVFMEIQLGKNLDENDIIRFEDVYGRV